jgi:hypothetical protein
VSSGRREHHFTVELMYSVDRRPFIESWTHLPGSSERLTLEQARQLADTVNPPTSTASEIMVRITRHTYLATGEGLRLLTTTDMSRTPDPPAGGKVIAADRLEQARKARADAAARAMAWTAPKPPPDGGAA